MAYQESSSDEGWVGRSQEDLEADGRRLDELIDLLPSLTSQVEHFIANQRKEDLRDAFGASPEGIAGMFSEVLGGAAAESFVAKVKNVLTQGASAFASEATTRELIKVEEHHARRELVRRWMNLIHAARGVFGPASTISLDALAMPQFANGRVEETKQQLAAEIALSREDIDAAYVSFQNRLRDCVDENSFIQLPFDLQIASDRGSLIVRPRC
jgi:hypothetical protein